MLEQIIDPQPLQVSVQTSVIEVISLMEKEKNNLGNKGVSNLSDPTEFKDSCALIVENTQLLGIFTEKDLIKLIAANRHLAHISVGEVMNRKIITLQLTGKENVLTAINLLAQHQISYLPVIGLNQQLIGLISQNNIFKTLKNNLFNLALDNLQNNNNEETKIKEKLSKEQIVSAIALKIRQSLDLDFILETTVVEVRKLIQASRVLIYRFEPDWSGFVTHEAVSNPQWSILQQTIKDSCFEEGLIKAYQKGNIFHVKDIYQSELSPCHIEFLASFQVRANVVIPILLSEENSSQEHLWGLLIVHQCFYPRNWQEDELELLQLLANQVAIAIKQGELYKQVRKELKKRKKTENLAKTLLDFAPVGIFQTNAIGNCLFVNAKWQEMTGISAAEALGQGWVKALHPEDIDLVYTQWYNAARNKTRFDLEYRYVNRASESQKELWVAGTAVPLTDEQGTVTGYLGTVINISDRKQREEILKDIALGVTAQAGDNFLASIVEYLSKTLKVDYVCIGKVAESERKVETLAVYHQGKISDNCEYDLANTPCEQIIDQEICVFPQVIQELFPKDRFLQELKAESYAGMPIFDSAGNIWGLIAIVNSKPFTDTLLITEVLKIFTTRATTELERQQAETLLKESQERYFLAVEGSSGGLFDWNILTNEVYYAPRFKKILDYGEGEEFASTFESWSSRLHPEDCDRVLQALSDHLENHIPYDIEYRLQTKNQAYCWVNARGQAIWNEQGQAVRMAGSIVDVGDRKRREAILKDIASGVSIEIGTNFLASLVEYLTRILQVDFAFISQIIDSKEKMVKTLAVYGRGKAIDNFEYSLVEAPCGNVIEQGVCFYPEAVRQLFPNVPPLQEMKAESYAGMPIFNNAGKVIGLIAVVDTKSFQEISIIEEVLKIFASRATSEIERQQAEADLQKSNQILEAISSVQTQFLANVEPQIVFDAMLARLLEITESEYGFIGEILFAADGSPMMEEGYLKVRHQPYLKTHAITNIAWDEETRAFYAENAPKGMEFHNLQTLFGAVIVTGQPVIANRPSTDHRRGGIPEGHPPLNSFLGIPFYQNNHLTGMVGIANRESGYDGEIINYLQPFLATCSRIIETVNSDRQKQKAEAKISQQAALLNIATDAIIVQGLNYQILFWNQGAEKLYGWTEQEALNQNFSELLSLDSLVELEAITKSLNERGEWQGEINQITKTGKNIIVESRWTLVKDEANKPQSFLIVNTDITEKKQLESQFLRTQRLESLGTLAGGIAHDLNNIFAPILGFAKLLPLTIPNVDEKTKRHFQIIATNAQRGSALVQQILTFSRGLEGDFGTLQIRHIIDEIKQIITETFPKAIELETNVPKNLWTVNGDANQLHQVLVNLVVNARDAMTDGGKLTIEAENFTVNKEYARLYLDASEGKYVLITVTDTGVGISPEIIDRIFEPFFTTKEIGRGTGLGLSTVIGIIKSHGGFIDVTSETRQDRKGTQIKVFLPTSETIATETQEEEIIPKGKEELILVVDDETSILEVTKATLEAYDYRVLTVNNGIDAIAIYVQNLQAIDLVIIDIMMPSMDGKTVIRTLKRIKPEIQIIAVSGLISSQQIVTEVDKDIAAFISKPYINNELLKVIAQIINY